MTRTLITGISGFTGRYLAPLLAESGHEIHGIVHDDPEDFTSTEMELYRADVANSDEIEAIVAEVRPHHVVHLAGIAFVAHSDVEQIYRSNIVGTRQLLAALSRLDEAPQSVLVASSANVYGNAREGVLDECIGLAPANDYGVSKVATEHVAALYRDRLPLIVTRPFNYTGRGQSTQFVIPKIVEHARQRRTMIELGNLEVARDFSDVRTVARIYARLLSEPRAIGETYNVCSGRAITIAEVLDMVARLCGHEFDVQVNPSFVRANEVKMLLGSSKKLDGVIGPIPSTPFEDTLGWMLNNGNDEPHTLR